MKKFWVFLVILVIIAIAAILVWQFAPAPAEQEQELNQAPVLFSKGDYQIIEKDREKYVKVEKVGLLAKIPKDWEIELNKTPDLEPQYWVDALSPDSEIKHSLLSKGCAISISAGNEKDNNEETKQNIKLIQNNPEKAGEIKKDYEFEVININNHQALKWFSSEIPMIGQFAGVNIPIGDRQLINLDTTFPPGYKEQCLAIWNEFIQNVEIK